MKGTFRNRRIWFAGLLGAAVLVGSSLVAQAEPGKGRNSKERGQGHERRVERQVRTHHGERGVRRDWSQARQHPQREVADRQFRTTREYRTDRQVRTERPYRTDRRYTADRRYRTDRRYSTDRQVRSGTRYRTDGQYRTDRQGYYGGGSGVWTWSRPRFETRYVVLDGGYRARRVYARPYFFEAQRLCVIRPVRFFLVASAGHRFYYGCNFCDLRFGGYIAYRTHVYHCDHRPAGYELEVSDWTDDWSQAACDIDDCETHGHGYAAGGYGDGYYEDEPYDAY